MQYFILAEASSEILEQRYCLQTVKLHKAI